MHIWNVANYEYTRLLLWRTEKDAFRVIQDGEYKAVLNNGDYTLVNNKFEDIFLLAYDQLNIQRVKIRDYQFYTVMESYIELTFLYMISPESIHREENQGYRVWGCDKHIFVSQELKDELEKVASNDLRFSPGFSFFAA
jgi:hypothetical protein